MVWRPSDLEKIDGKTQAARIAHTVGENKRVQIIDQAKKANIRVLNPGVKKEAEVVPEVVTEPTAPTEPGAEATTEPPAAEPTAEATPPETEGKEPKESEAAEAPKKPRKGKGGKKGRKKK
jgi:hypothetical protein